MDKAELKSFKEECHNMGLNDKLVALMHSKYCENSGSRFGMVNVNKFLNQICRLDYFKVHELGLLLFPTLEAGKITNISLKNSNPGLSSSDNKESIIQITIQFATPPFTPQTLEYFGNAVNFQAEFAIGNIVCIKYHGIIRGQRFRPSIIRGSQQDSLIDRTISLEELLKEYKPNSNAPAGKQYVDTSERRCYVPFRQFARNMFEYCSIETVEEYIAHNIYPNSSLESFVLMQKQCHEKDQFDMLMQIATNRFPRDVTGETPADRLTAMMTMYNILSFPFKMIQTTFRKTLKTLLGTEIWAGKKIKRPIRPPTSFAAAWESSLHCFVEHTVQDYMNKHASSDRSEETLKNASECDYHTGESEIVQSPCRACGLSLTLESSGFCSKCQVHLSHILADIGGYRFSKCVFRKLGWNDDHITLKTHVWVEEYDHFAKRTFVYNIATGESTWEANPSIPALSIDRLGRRVMEQIRQESVPEWKVHLYRNKSKKANI